uniref:NACHT domain-containing protein n=1 Tax=Monopterus albus TaxID=43700 RepID=A0A3Q3KF26_MONAL
MDQEVDPDEDSVNSILAQESSDLFHILSSQSPTVIMKLCQLMPGSAGLNPGHPATSSAAVTELIQAMLDYFTAASVAHCSDFVQRMCILCENIPLHLETRLMSAAAYAYNDCGVPDEKSSPPPSEQQLIKRPRLDHWEQYIDSVMNLLLKRWERLSRHLVREVQLDNVWVSQRMSTRGRDRPDQTPGSADRGSRTPEPDGDFGSLEPRVTLETFLQGCAGKVTVFVGQPGSGKTLLMSCLGQQWARGLGPIPSSYLFILLEFCQLSLLSHPLSLSELLFQYYLPPKGGDDKKKAIVDYLRSNPEQSCWVLDGYDEFRSKLSRQEVQRELLDPDAPLPVVQLISGLLNRQLLPGCTVLVTCRARDVKDLEGISDKVGQLLGWGCLEIKEYVDSFFGVKGDSANRALRAADLLLSSRHLLAMSSLPALCNICCICLKHLLLEDKDRGTKKEVKGVQIPSTHTQVYLTVLEAFLSCDSNKGGKIDEAKTIRTLQSSTLTQYQSELCELSRLAWRGLEESKILFMEEDISPDVLEFSVRTGLFSEVELRREDGVLVKAYCFIHLTLQEFLAALRIMTSNDVSDMQLRRRFSLKTRWMTKSDQRTVFTDSLHLYVCGLASSCCTPTLVEFAKASGGGGQSWVQKRQAFILKLLGNLCHSNTLTGPKILELCHCVQESQDHRLAKCVVRTRPTLELRNIYLLPDDIDALAFVVNSADDVGVGLDFGACSMEPECLDILPQCQYIHCLSFRSRKYGDTFAVKLSSILPELRTLRKFDLSDNSLKDEGIKHIADIFTKLSRLVSVMLGRNNSSLEAVVYLVGKMSSSLNIQHVHADGMKEVTVTFFQKSDMNSLLNQKWSESEMQKLAKSLACCPALSVLDFSGGQWDVETLRTLIQFLPKFNVTQMIILHGSCSSVEGLVVLTALLSDCPSVVELLIRYKHTCNVRNDTDDDDHEAILSISLSSCGLLPADMNRVWRSLGTSSDLTVLDLSSNCLGDKSLKKLLAFLPHPSANKTKHSKCFNLFKIKCGSNQIYLYKGGTEQVLLKFCPDKRLNNSILLPSDITILCRRLVQCHSPLELDLSHSSLKDDAIESLLKVLPKMASLRRLNVSHSIMSTTGALTLVSCLTVSQRVTSVGLSPECESFIHFDSVKAEQTSCRLTHFNLTSDDLERLLEILQQGPPLSDLDLSSNHLGDKGVKQLVESLPSLKITSYVNLSSNSLTQQGLLDVASSLCTCDNISDVEVRLGKEERCLIWFTQYGGCEKTLSVRESNLEREHLVRLAEIVATCPSLTKLEFKNNSLQSGWIEDFVKLLNGGQRGLRVLISALLSSSLVGCALQGYQLAPMRSIIQRCPLLKELDFSQNSLGVEGAEFFCSVLPWLPNLTSLSIASKETCAAVDEKLSEALLQATSIQSLNLSHSEWSPVGGLQLVQALGQCVSLEACVCVCVCVCVRARLNETVTLMGTSDVDSMLDLLAAMEGLTQMEELELEGWRMADRGVQQLTRLLSTWKELRKISLSKNNVSDQSGKQLLEALTDCRHLEELHLSRNCLGDLTAASMALVLPLLTHITVLDISENRIGYEGSASLSKAIMCMMNLTKINLTSVGTAELCVVAASLAHCPLIQDVSMGWNNCRDNVAVELAKTLPLCTKLTRIDLESNSIMVFGAEALVKALQSCPALQLIRLWRNKISLSEAQRLMDRDGRLNFSST